MWKGNYLFWTQIRVGGSPSEELLLNMGQHSEDPNSDTDLDRGPQTLGTQSRKLCTGAWERTQSSETRVFHYSF